MEDVVLVIDFVLPRRSSSPYSRDNAVFYLYVTSVSFHNLITITLMELMILLKTIGVAIVGRGTGAKDRLL